MLLLGGFQKTKQRSAMKLNKKNIFICVAILLRVNVRIVTKKKVATIYNKSLAGLY